MTTQPALFDPATTQPQQCPVCNQTRPAGTPKTERCEYDRNREDWLFETPRWRKRPAGCLNATNPKHQNIPF